MTIGEFIDTVHARLKTAHAADLDKPVVTYRDLSSVLIHTQALYEELLPEKYDAPLRVVLEVRPEHKPRKPLPPEFRG